MRLEVSLAFTRVRPMLMFLLDESVQLSGTDRVAHCRAGLARGMMAFEQFPHCTAAEASDSVAER